MTIISLYNIFGLAKILKICVATFNCVITATTITMICKNYLEIISLRLLTFLVLGLASPPSPPTSADSDSY